MERGPGSDVEQCYEDKNLHASRRTKQKVKELQESEYYDSKPHRLRKKSRPEHIDSTPSHLDCELDNDNIEISEVKHKRRTKQDKGKRRKPADACENDQDLHDHSELSKGDQSYVHRAIIQPTHIQRIVSKPLNITDDDVSEADTECEVERLLQVTEPSPKPTKRKTKLDDQRQMHSSFADDLTVSKVSDEEEPYSKNTYEPLKPVRNGSYLHNSLDGRSLKPDKTSRKLLKSQSVDIQDPDVATKSTKTSKLAKLAQLKKQKTFDESHALKSFDTTHVGNSVETPSPKHRKSNRVVASPSDSDEDRSPKLRHDSISKRSVKSTHSGKSKSPVVTPSLPHRTKANTEAIHSNSPKRHKVLKTSIMPFNLSDDSSSDDDVDGEKPGLRKRPSAVRRGSLFDGFDNATNDDIDNASELSDEEEEVEVDDLSSKRSKHRHSDVLSHETRSVTQSETSKASTEDSKPPSGKAAAKAKTSKKDKKSDKKAKAKPVSASSSPVVSRKTSTTRPPRPDRKSVHGYPHAQRSDSPTGSVSSHAQYVMKGIFSIDGHTYDVFMKEDRLTWRCVSRSNKGIAAILRVSTAARLMLLLL